MGNLSPILKNKKLLLLAGFAIVLIITAVILSLHKADSQPPTTNSTTRTTEINTLPTQTTEKITTPTITTNRQTPQSQSISQFAIKNWILSDNDIYTFQYPTDWKLQRTRFANGQTITIIPQNDTVPSLTPSWSITITKTIPNDPITNKEKFYESLNFKKENITLSNQTAQKLSGTFPNATAPDAIQQTTIYLARDNYNYLISYKYPGKTSNQQLEQLFEKITATLSIEY